MSLENTFLTKLHESLNKVLQPYEIDVFEQQLNNNFPFSYPARFYLACIYEQNKLWNYAEAHYLKSIEIKPSFIEPAFNLANYYLKEKEPNSKIVKLLLPYWNTKTLDPTSPSGLKSWQIMHQLRLASILIPIILNDNNYSKVISMCKEVIQWIKNTPFSERNYRHYEIGKNAYISLGVSVLKLYEDMDSAYNAYANGLLLQPKLPFSSMEMHMLNQLDKTLLQHCLLAKQYVTVDIPQITCQTIGNWVTKIYKPITNITHVFSEKIKIGYLSPDFNKNAVGCFLTALLKFFDKSKFEVICFDNSAQQNIDPFSKMFRSWPDITWVDITNMTDEEVYTCIRQTYKIDILFDLIGHGAGNRLELLAKKPAPIIINYLGYPDYTYLSSIDYRLVDTITDTYNNQYAEKLLKLPRCFVCFTPFEIIKKVDIHPKILDSKKTYLGVFNKLAKWHPELCKTWASILKRRKDMVLCIKRGEADTESAWNEKIKLFPKEQLLSLPFTHSLDEYYDLFNSVDISIDTYPYSGTTTTCSSLYMGVPVFTVYNPKAKHVSNVTASILLHTDKEDYKKYIYNDLKSYEDAIVRWKPTRTYDKEIREKRRKQFLETMNPEIFMKDFESVLEKL